MEQWFDIDAFRAIYDAAKAESTTGFDSLRESLPRDRFYFNSPLGWHHSKSEIEKRVFQQGEMPYLVLDTGSVCRYKCKLCYTRSNEHDRRAKYPQPLSLEQKKEIMTVARNELATETLIIEGAGEPSLNSETLPLLEHAIFLGLRAIVFNSGIHLERLLPLIEQSGGSVGLKFHGLPPQMTANVYNEILGQKDAWTHLVSALELIFEKRKLNQPVYDADGNLLAMTRVVLDNYITPQGLDALLPSLSWAYEHNCAIVLAGDIPSDKSLNALDYVSPDEFSLIILKARFFNWVRKWMPPGRAHLASECEQKYGLRITDGLVSSDGIVRGNVYGCVGEPEAFLDIRNLQGAALAEGIKRAWALRKQWIVEGCQPRFNALVAYGVDSASASQLYTAPVQLGHSPPRFSNFQECFQRFWQIFGTERPPEIEKGPRSNVIQPTHPTAGFPNAMA